MKKYLTLILTLFAFISLYSQKNDSLMDYSMRLIQKQEFAKAIPHLIKYSSNNPDHLNSKLQLAFCYTQTNELEKSNELYRKIISARPEYDRAYYMLANNYYRLNNSAKALEMANSALNLVADDPDYLLMKGQALRQSGDAKQACKYFKKAKKAGSSEAKFEYTKYCK
jgi:tetratricopeptide (TPR) repeat protein